MSSNAAGRLAVLAGVGSSVVVIGAAVAGASAGSLVALGGLAVVGVLLAGRIDERHAAITPLAPLTETSQEAVIDAPTAGELVERPGEGGSGGAHTDAA